MAPHLPYGDADVLTYADDCMTNGVSVCVLQADSAQQGMARTAGVAAPAQWRCFGAPSAGSTADLQLFN